MTVIYILTSILLTALVLLLAYMFQHEVCKYIYWLSSERMKKVKLFKHFIKPKTFTVISLVCVPYYITIIMMLIVTLELLWN